MYLLIANNLKGFSHGLEKLILALCGLWNLDFFRPIVPPFCISPNMKNLRAFALEYIEAFYPLILILITYICIKLHDHNFRAVVLLLCSSILTFSCSSNIKFLHGDRCGFLFVHDKRHCCTEMVSWEHAACVGLVFTVLPTLLLVLYPTRIFRKCISCCGFRRWHALHTFVEAFQGQYKDGTNGTQDFRMVSALFLIFRIAVLLAYSGNHNSFDHAYVWLIESVVLFGASLFFSIVRPYKVNNLNTIDCLLLGMLSILAWIGCLLGICQIKGTAT